MIVTIDTVRQTLDYAKIVTRPQEQMYGERTDRYTIFSAVPEDETQLQIDMYFNESCDVVELVSFGPWHGHFDSAEDEEDNIRNAFRAVRSLIHREETLVEQHDESGRYRGSELLAPDRHPDTLGFDIRTLRRVTFGQPPRDEPVDYSRYHRGKHLWISLSRKAEVEGIYRAHDLPLPEW